MDNYVNKISNGLPDPFSIKVKAKFKHEVDYNSIISSLKNVGISPKRELAPGNTFIQGKDKIQVLSSIQMRNYIIAKEVAKKIAKVAIISIKKRIETCKSWSDKETNILFELIERHGTSWGKLKENDDDNVILSRDKTSLRDKAIRMKIVYMKWVCILFRDFIHKQQTYTEFVSYSCLFKS